MMIASLRATAMIARRKPRRLATATPQAFNLFHVNESETEKEEHPSNGQGRGLIEYSAALR
jgi:hypothetical protein